MSKNDDVDPRISNKKVSEIKKENPHLVEILENVTIPITVLRCDSKNPEHMKYLFQIFYRLNSGGNKLYNQEIRNCIFQGSFNTLLKELARTPEWYTFANTDQKKLTKQDLIMKSVFYVSSHFINLIPITRENLLLF